MKSPDSDVNDKKAYYIGYLVLDSLRAVMAKLFSRFCVAIVSLLSMSGCSSGPEIFEHCTLKKWDGSLDETCTSAVLDDGTCKEGFVKVKSAKYKYPSCIMEL